MNRNAVAGGVFLLCFGINLFLAFPSLSPFRDAGDLAASAATLGVAHPPGYPAYVLIGRAFQTLVPFSNPAYRLNALSALCGAGATLFLFLILRRFGGAASAGMGAALAACLPAALAQYGLSEIYALHALFSWGLLWAAFGVTDLPPARRGPAWVLLAFSFGLGLANHQTLVLAVPPLLALFWRDPVAAGRRVRLLGWGALAVAAGFSLHAFLPLRSLAGAETVWGEPHTLGGFWDMITRADYGSATLSTRHSTAPLGQALVFWLWLWRWEWGLLGSTLGLLALAWTLQGPQRRSWGGPLALLWVFTGPVFALAARLAPGELSQAILQPMLVVPGLAAAAALGLWLGALWRRGRFWAPAALSAFLLFIGLKGLPGALGQNHRHNHVASDYGQNLLRAFPPGAAALMISDGAIFSVAYRQSAARQRPDLRVLVDADLPWRWRLYRRRFPDLVPEGQPDGGLALARFQGGRVPLFTEGMQAKLMDALCPSALTARVTWPRRSDACAAELEEKAWQWDLYVRRVPSSLTLLNDHYSRGLLKTVSSGAFNAGLLLSQAGRAEAARALYARALFWNPDRLLRWAESF